MMAPVMTSRGEYLDTPLLAIADLIVATDDGLLVREIKTAARAWAESEATSSLQPTCYVNNTQEAYGEPTTVEYTVLVKTKQPKIQHLDAKRSPEDLGRLGDIIETVERAVQAKIFLPNESPLNCSTCPYREPCRDWGRPKIPAESLLPVVEVEA
jgi:CRISPR/Cas system-associated exonuclease Cas4 (RecB family)